MVQERDYKPPHQTPLFDVVDYSTNENKVTSNG